MQMCMAFVDMAAARLQCWVAHREWEEADAEPEERLQGLLQVTARVMP